MRKRVKGLTLIELVVVIALISMLMGIILPQGLKMRERARIAKVKLQLHNIAEALESFRNQEGEYPIALNELNKEDPYGVKKYFTQLPLKDPWGNTYFYDAWEYGGTIYTSPLLRRYTPPRWETLRFSAEPGEYSMILHLNKVSSARVILNGRSVFRPCCFNRHTQTITQKVNLTSSNTIEVRITSDPSATMQIEIVYPLPEGDFSSSCLPPAEYAEKGYNWSSVYGKAYYPGFILGSYGRDGKPGGEGFNKDIIYGKVEE